MTHTATAVAAAWLHGLGCKPVETEVSLASGWVADLATFWQPTMTEAKRARLLRDIVPKEWHDDGQKGLSRLYRVFGGRITVLVEVKVSKSDFRADLGRKYGTRTNRAQLLSPAHMCVLAAPASVLDDAREIDGWGFLRLSEDCSRVVKWEGPWISNRLGPIDVEDFIASVAVRRHNVTQYAASRRFWKAYRAGRAKP